MTVLLDGLNSELGQRIGMMIGLSENKLRISSAVRTRAEQEVLYAAFKKDPVHNATAAKPGTSNHERGLAVDVECAAKHNALRAQLARDLGLHTPVRGEAWHMELAPVRKPLQQPTTIQEANKVLGIISKKRRAVALVLNPVGPGYMIASNDGGVYCFGGFPFFGSMGDKKLNADIASAVATATGKGYVLVGEDGGVFAFGDAQFAGSAVEYLK